MPGYEGSTAEERHFEVNDNSVEVDESEEEESEEAESEKAEEETAFREARLSSVVSLVNGHSPIVALTHFAVYDDEANTTIPEVSIPLFDSAYDTHSSNISSSSAELNEDDSMHTSLLLAIPSFEQNVVHRMNGSSLLVTLVQ